MYIKAGVVLGGLDIRLRPALIVSEELWKKYGRTEGVTVTSALDGLHSAGSLHYYGLAVDLRIHYFHPDIHQQLVDELRWRLGDDFDVVLHSTHIHVEYDPKEN